MGLCMELEIMWMELCMVWNYSYKEGSLELFMRLDLQIMGMGLSMQLDLQITWNYVWNYSYK